MNTLRTLIRVDISIDQQWAVGAAPDLWFRPDADDIDDKDRTTRMPVQKDPSGAIQLPATSLVGSLRRHLKDDATIWLGSPPPDKGGKTEPSALRCLAAIVHQPNTTEVSTTAIDPERRAAAANSLRTEEIVDPATVSWWIEWDHKNPDVELRDLLDHLKTWHPVVGRRRSANRGRAHVAKVFHRTVDLSEENGLTWWLAERPRIEWASQSPLPSSDWESEKGGSADEGEPVLSVELEVADGLHIGGKPPVDNLLPTRSTIPSTSWRGIFRHRVEHIVRVSTEDTESAKAKVKVAEVAARLFGSGRGRGASADSGHRGQLRFGSSKIEGSRLKRIHVAIDRVSGGAAQFSSLESDKSAGALFEVEYFGPGSSLELKIYNDSPDPVGADDLALLKAVIRDIDEGVIGVGGMTSRGYGTLCRKGGCK